MLDLAALASAVGSWEPPLTSTGWWVEIAVVVALCAALALLAWWRDLLTPEGSAAAFAIGALIGVFGGWEWVLVLLVFMVSSFAATRYKFEVKKTMGLQEGTRGERGTANVLANGAVACMAALARPWLGEHAALLFLVAVAAAAADTLASELGVLSEKAYLITTGKRVPPGTDGGVSAYGTGWALAAAVYTSLVGGLFLAYTGALEPTALSLLLPIEFGFVGCNLDSLFGATLERKGYLTKLTNNLMSIALATTMAAVVLLA